MSLFKAREWWHAICGSGEEFDGAAMCVANIDNDPQGQGACCGRLSVWHCAAGPG